MPAEEIRAILAPLSSDHVLLPNSVVAEVLDFTRPEPFKEAPAWLLGELAWNGWQVPVISYEHLIDDNTGAPVVSKARILVIKTLGESTQVNYIGLLIQGLPKLKKLTRDTLNEKQTSGLHDALFSIVNVDKHQALIPEMGELARTVEQTAYEN